MPRSRVVRALAIAINASVLLIEATFAARNLAAWGVRQTVGYGLLFLSTGLTLMALLLWPDHDRER